MDTKIYSINKNEGGTAEDRITTEVTETGKYSALNDSINPQDLYPLSSELNHHLHMAMQLLNTGTNLLNTSYNNLAEGDVLGSDNELLKFQAILPELFCCREIGDGFAIIVNSLYHSLKNLHGQPTNIEQIKAIKQVVNRLSTELFISFDEALNELNKLSVVELEISPEYLKYLTELLSE